MDFKDAQERHRKKREKEERIKAALFSALISDKPVTVDRCTPIFKSGKLSRLDLQVNIAGQTLSFELTVNVLLKSLRLNLAEIEMAEALREVQNRLQALQMQAPFELVDQDGQTLFQEPGSL